MVGAMALALVMTAAAFVAFLVAALVAFAVMMVVVVALSIRIEIQTSTDKGFYCFVCITAYAAIQLDASLCQSHLRTAADAAANKDICIQRRKESGQGTVSAAVGVKNFCVYDFAVLYLVKLKLCGMTEVLKDLTVFIGYCNFHC